MRAGSPRRKQDPLYVQFHASLHVFKEINIRLLPFRQQAVFYVSVQKSTPTQFKRQHQSLHFTHCKRKSVVFQSLLEQAGRNEESSSVPVLNGLSLPFGIHFCFRSTSVEFQLSLDQGRACPTVPKTLGQDPSVPFVTLWSKQPVSQWKADWSLESEELCYILFSFVISFSLTALTTKGEMITCNTEFQTNLMDTDICSQILPINPEVEFL